jgi:membrane protein
MKLWPVIKQAGNDWLANKAPRLGAALAYYAAFAIAPLLVIVIAVTGWIFGPEAVRGHLNTQIEGLVGPDGGKAVESMVANASKPASSITASIIGIVVLLIGAGGLFGELQDALNTIWGVEPKTDRGWLDMLRDRFLSFTMVFGSAFLLLVSLVVSAALSALSSVLGEWGITITGQVVNIVVSLAVVTLLFAMIFRYLPDAKIAWRNVWFGAAVTAVLFTIGKFLIGLYIGYAGTTSSYGAAGSFAALLIWLYYSTQIFLFGAELTKAYATQSGSNIKPAENAVLVK